jgi:hypothetical protein
MEESVESARVSPVKIAMGALATDGVLASREDARTARTRIEHEIAKQRPGEPIALDFTDVAAISITFADECVGRLLSSRLAGYDDNHPILALNTDEAVRDTLDAALRARRLVLLALSDDGPELLGGDEVLTETLMEAVRLRTFTVAEIAEKLRLTPQAANNRLAHLVRSGALSRARIIPSRGGREFRYELPVTPEDKTRLVAP